jgi:hypothetical protein
VSLVRRWPGAEYLWPQQFLVDDEEDAVQRIARYSADEALFRSAAAEGRAAIKERYGIDTFVGSTVDMFREFM